MDDEGDHLQALGLVTTCNLKVSKKVTNRCRRYACGAQKAMAGCRNIKVERKWRLGGRSEDEKMGQHPLPLSDQI